MKKPTVPSMTDLGTLSTHELAELLANVVLLLRRFPDVPISDVTNSTSTSNGHDPMKDPRALAAKVRREPKKQVSTEMPDWLEDQ